MSRWPRATVSVDRVFAAMHSLPDLGVEEPHAHEYRVRAGFTHEINPSAGCTMPMQTMVASLDIVLAPLRTCKLLNEVLQPPTAEVMAQWILQRLPPYWQFVEIECYEGFRVRVLATDRVPATFKEHA